MKRIYIICEGYTESNYIQAFNRFLNNEGIWDLHLIPSNLCGLSSGNYYQKLESAVRKLSGKTRNDDIYTWIDFDILKRSGEKDIDIKKELENIKFLGKSIKPLFNYMNGEDFIVLHENFDTIKKWENICNQNNHFNNPMHEKEYYPLFKDIITNYKKGNVPKLDIYLLEQCVKNSENNSIPFKSDIIEILKIVINKLKI